MCLIFNIFGSQCGRMWGWVFESEWLSVCVCLGVGEDACGRQWFGWANPAVFGKTMVWMSKSCCVWKDNGLDEQILLCFKRQWFGWANSAVFEKTMVWMSKFCCVSKDNFPFKVLKQHISHSETKIKDKILFTYLE